MRLLRVVDLLVVASRGVIPTSPLWFLGIWCGHGECLCLIHPVMWLLEDYILITCIRLHCLMITIHCSHWLLCLRHYSIESLEDLVMDESFVSASMGRPSMAHIARVVTTPRWFGRLCGPILRIHVLSIKYNVSSRLRRLLVSHELVCPGLLDFMRRLARRKP